MNDYIIDRMKQDFDEKLNTDIPGQNHDCDLIHTFGFDGGMTAFSEPARCVCVANVKDSLPVFRTSHGYPIFTGMLVSLKDEDGFYLLADRVQKNVNCYSTKATPCNAQITIVTDIPAETDDDGYLVQEETIVELVKSIPCVIKSNPTLSNGDGGLIVDDTLKVIIQLNKFTRHIQAEDHFSLDGEEFRVYAKRITGNNEQTQGIIELTCKKIAGSSR